MKPAVLLLSGGLDSTTCLAWARDQGFAEPGQLLVSHSYFEVVTRVSEHYKRLFVRVGMVQDKHVRDHDIYLVDDDIRLNEDPLAPPRPEPAAPRGPAKVADTGTALMISGSRAAVEAAMRDMVAKGATALSVPSQVGAKWYASCSHPGQQNIECKESSLLR